MEDSDKISRTKVWLRAFRLHTLPLAFACICLGNFLAYRSETFRFSTGFLTLFTAICLQILSNLANDYGDAKNGADNEKRKGPVRMVQTGMITVNAIKKGIIIFTLLSLVSGVTLLLSSLQNIGYKGAIVLFLLGLLAIAAAIAYTATKKPYGYRGLGDVSVFIFFGLIAVYGSYYLQTGKTPLIVLLPSIAMGLLCTGVLNVNNIRDVEADTHAGKMTIPVKIGLKNAKIYHWFLMVVPLLLCIAYIEISTGIAGSPGFLEFQLLFLLPGILFIKNAIGVSKSQTSEETAPYLKKLAISILVFSLSFGFSLVGLN